MQINSYDYSGISSAVAASQLRYAQSPSGTQNEQGKGAVGSVKNDSYVHGEMDFAASGVYSAPMAMGPGGLPGVQSASESGDDLMSQMSDTFRANEDSIRAAMEELGLSEEDLADAENMALLANAMNEGAAKLGVPQMEDVDAAVEKLMNVQATGGSSEKATSGAPGVAGGAGGAGAPAGAGGAGGAGESESSSEEDEDETTTRIVMVGGTPYLETTTTKDGVTSRTLTALGGGGSIHRESLQPFSDTDAENTNRLNFNFGSYGSLGMYTHNFNAA